MFNIQISGRHVLVTEAMKKHAQDKLAKLEKLQGHKVDIHVTMDIQKLDQIVDIILQFDRIKIKAHAVTTDMYASIDQAVAKLHTQITRWKDKIHSHNNRKLSSVDIQVNVVKGIDEELEEINEEIEFETKQNQEKALEPGHVMGHETIVLKDLTTDEAIMKMELTGDHFLLYKGEEDRKIKVIYRRKDGNYGIIQAQ